MSCAVSLKLHAGRCCIIFCDKSTLFRVIAWFDQATSCYLNQYQTTYKASPGITELKKKVQHVKVQQLRKWANVWHLLRRIMYKMHFKFLSLKCLFFLESSESQLIFSCTRMVSTPHKKKENAQTFSLFSEKSVLLGLSNFPWHPELGDYFSVNHHWFW